MQLPPQVRSSKHLLLSPTTNRLHDLVIAQFSRHLSIVTVAHPLIDGEYIEMHDGTKVHIDTMDKYTNKTTVPVTPMFCDGFPFEECYLCNMDDYGRSTVHKHSGMFVVNRSLLERLVASNNKDVIAVTSKSDVMSRTAQNPLEMIPDSFLDVNCDNYVFGYKYVIKLSPATCKTLFMESYLKDDSSLGGDLWLIHIVKINKNI